MYRTPEQRTQDQLKAVILIDCIEQCNKAKLPQEEYEQKLRGMLRERLGTDGQLELEALL